MTRRSHSPERRQFRHRRAWLVVVFIGAMASASVSACAYEPPARIKDSRGSSVPVGAVGPDGELISGGGPIESANNVKAVSLLQRARTAAQYHFSESGSMTDFTPELALTIEPSVNWNTSSAAVLNQVSIRDAQEASIVFVTSTPSGPAACITMDLAAATVRYGNVDAATTDACVDTIAGVSLPST